MGELRFRSRLRQLDRKKLISKRSVRGVMPRWRLRYLLAPTDRCFHFCVMNTQNRSWDWTEFRVQFAIKSVPNNWEPMNHLRVDLFGIPKRRTTVPMSIRLSCRCNDTSITHRREATIFSAPRCARRAIPSSRTVLIPRVGKPNCTNRSHIWSGAIRSSTMKLQPIRERARAVKIVTCRQPTLTDR